MSGQWLGYTDRTRKKTRSPEGKREKNERKRYECSPLKRRGGGEKGTKRTFKCGSERNCKGSDGFLESDGTVLTIPRVKNIYRRGVAGKGNTHGEFFSNGSQTDGEKRGLG